MKRAPVRKGRKKKKTEERTKVLEEEGRRTEAQERNWEEEKTMAWERMTEGQEEQKQEGGRPGDSALRTDVLDTWGREIGKAKEKEKPARRSG